jgi:hypothetical protein
MKYEAIANNYGFKGNYYYAKGEIVDLDPKDNPPVTWFKPLFKIEETKVEAINISNPREDKNIKRKS